MHWWEESGKYGPGPNLADPLLGEEQWSVVAEGHEIQLNCSLSGGGVAKELVSSVRRCNAGLVVGDQLQP